MKRFVPTHDLILIRPLDGEKVGSLYLPANRTSLPTTTGVVVAVGPGGITMMGSREPMDLPVGSTVMVRNGGESHPNMKIGGENHILVRFGDVLGTVEND